MKSLKDYSLNLPENEYHAYPAWSHSLIARYARDGFSAIATLHEPFKTTPAMEFGSLFDSILTRGKETLNSYIVDDTETPPAEKTVFDYLLKQDTPEKFCDIDEQTLISAMDACKFYPKFTIPTRLAKLNNASNYFDARKTGKNIVSHTDWNDAIEMAHVFRNNEYLNKLFGTKNTKDIEYIYQAQFVVELDCTEGSPVKFKIMPDLLVVNHKTKTVQPVDLKTSSMPAYDFKESFLRFRYDIEAAAYTDVLRIIMDSDEDYKDYKILPYLFTDISRVDKVPVTYIYNPLDDSQKDGFEYTSNGKTYNHKHWTTLLGEILEYESTRASVPEWISTEKPNDILSIINK